MLDARGAARARRDLKWLDLNDQCDAAPVPTLTRTSQRTARTFNTAHVPPDNVWCRPHCRPSRLGAPVSQRSLGSPLSGLAGGRVLDPPLPACVPLKAVRRAVAARHTFFFAPVSKSCLLERLSVRITQHFSIRAGTEGCSLGCRRTGTTSTTPVSRKPGANPGAPNESNAEELRNAAERAAEPPVLADRMKCVQA
jgi:hypothetical protein